MSVKPFHACESRWEMWQFEKAVDLERFPTCICHKGFRNLCFQPCETSKQMGPELAERSSRQVVIQMDEVLSICSLWSLLWSICALYISNWCVVIMVMGLYQQLAVFYETRHQEIAVAGGILYPSIHLYMCTCPIPLKRSRPQWPNISAVPLNIYIFFKIEEGKKKPWGNFFKCGADVCLDLRLIALKIYWSKGQGCVRITAEGIKFVEGNKDVSSTGPFQLNGGRWVLLTSRERQWSGCVVWGNNVTRYHWSYWRCVRERKTV